MELKASPNSKSNKYCGCDSFLSVKDISALLHLDRAKAIQMCT
jgi:hypothetical protein